MLQPNGDLVLDTAPAYLPAAEAITAGARFVGLHGGRGSGKSHFLAETCIEAALCDPDLRIACLREVQKSLTMSSKLLIEDKIRKMGVQHYFRILNDRIERRRGTGLVIFQGMQNHTADSIKSLEGFKLGWFEEAQRTSARSLDLLTPTFRGGAQLLFSWNPENDTDPVDSLFRGAVKHPNAYCQAVQWSDNPWFPDDLRADMEYDRRRDPAKYAHVWEGGYLVLSEARVFKNWRVEEFETPENVTFYFGADWGFSIDPAVLVRCFIVGRTLYVDYEAYKIGLPVDHTPHFFAGMRDEAVNRLNPEAHKALLAARVDYPGIVGSRKWQVTADSARPETIDYMKRHGFPRMTPAVKGAGSVQEGVEFLQGYDIVVHPRCRHTADELANYRYKTDPRSGIVIPVLEDKKNHVIDACIAEGSRVLTNRGAVPIEAVTTDDRVLTRGGLRKVLFAGLTGTDRDMVRVTTTTGVVYCTPDHRIITAHGDCRADALIIGDVVFGIAKSAIVPARVVTVSEAERCARVYDLTVEGDEEFIVDGVLVHNCRYATEPLRRNTVFKISTEALDRI